MSNIDCPRLYYFETYKKLVSGFIRNNGETNNNNIPNVITSLCLLFYYIKQNEYFKTFHSCLESSQKEPKSVMQLKSRYIIMQLMDL